MEIRGDLRSVDTWLHRLLTYADAFWRFNKDDWSHLKNKEDFNRVNSLPFEQKLPLESIYSDGRDIAFHMSQKLPAFNYADQYPSLKDFVDSFNHGWIYQIDLLENQAAEAKAINSGLQSPIWAIDKMINLYLKQIDLLRNISQCINFLRNSELYRAESGYSAPHPNVLAYEVILACINNVGKMFERLPKTYAGKDEEGLRDHMLVTLEAAVSGSATGETFNRRGKTDILVRSEGSNVFVAECKFWSGPKGLLETTDQLLGYLGWRDNQAAAVIFVRNVDFGEALRSATTTVQTHSNFIRHVSTIDSTWENYEFRSIADSGRSVSVALMLYHLGPV